MRSHRRDADSSTGTSAEMPDVDAFRRGVAERGALYDLIPVCPRERRDLMTECPCSVVAAPFERLASSPQARIGVNSES